jgi:hypothetical protein
MRIKVRRHPAMSKPVWATAFEAYAEQLFSSYNIPGVAVAVAKDGIPIYEHGFGQRDLEKGLPITPDTVFGIGSITKSFTCVALMETSSGRVALIGAASSYVTGALAAESRTDVGGRPGINPLRYETEFILDPARLAALADIDTAWARLP